MTLKTLVQMIGPEDADARAAARRNWDACAKPLGSLGLLETALEDIAALTGSAEMDLRRRAVLVFCADNGLRRKIAAIQSALAVNRPDPEDAVDVLAKVGGLDLAALCGAFLGGAAYRVPVLMDGFISAAAALCAVRVCPAASKAILASHMSMEPASRLLLDTLGKQPLITANMRLGEGTGAVAAMPLLDMACAVYSEAYTFDEGGIEAYTPQGAF